MPLPLVGALVGGASCPRARPELAKRVAFGWSLAVLALAVGACGSRSRPAATGSSSASRTRGSRPGARSFTFAVDGIALVMLMLIAVLVPLVILASWHDADERRSGRCRSYFALLLALECTMIGVFAAADVFLFYVFFEVMLVPMYFLIGCYGGHQRQYAAVKFFLYSLVGGLFMLAAVIGLWVLGGHTFDWQTLTDGGLLHQHRALAVPRLLPRVRDQGAVLPVPHLAARRRWRGPGRRGRAAGRRAGQGRHVRHPALLPAAVPGGVAVLRAAGRWRWRWSASSTRALLAVGQNDLKRLVSYTSIAHFGFIGIGIFAFTTQAGTGAVLYMVNHGLATGLLFLVVGMLVARRGSRAGQRLRRRRQAGAGAGRGASSSPVSPRWRCPARRRSSPSSWC